jgi:nucleoside-diphosphate-sugar epimerase
VSVAVIGANGFIGGALFDRLRASGVDAVPVVRQPRGLPGERVAGDFNESVDWTAVLTGVDTIIHAAARVHVMRDRSADPLTEFRRVNRDGTANLAQQAASKGVRRLVFISTIKVNGESTAPGRPFRADDAPNPSDAYAISKYEAEQILSGVAGLETVIIRPPMVYGPGAAGNFKSMARWVEAGVPLPLGAATGNRRSLVAIDNLLDLICLGMTHPAAAGRVFLASDGADVSTAELLRKLGAAMGKPARLLPVPPRMLHMAAALVGRRPEADRLLGNLQVDIGDTRDRLGWEPRIGLEEGLMRAFREPSLPTGERR